VALRTIRGPETFVVDEKIDLYEEMPIHDLGVGPGRGEAERSAGCGQGWAPA
jgi:hypothetical protein